MTTREYVDGFNEIQDEWSWKDYDDFMKKYGPEGDREQWVKFGTVCIAWEQIGILVKHRAFDPEMLYDQWAGFFIRFWEKIEPVIIEYNMRHGGRFLEYAEDLYYFFKEAESKDLAEFKVREELRIKKRMKLGLKPRQVYDSTL